MKHLHLSLVVVFLALVIAQVYCVFAKKRPANLLKISTHIMAMLLLMPAVLMVIELVKAGVRPHWALAKAILMVVVISAMGKSMRAHRAYLLDITNTQAAQKARVGAMMAVIVCVAIVWLAFAKPMLGA